MDDADKATDLEESRTQATLEKISKKIKAANPNIMCEGDCGGEIGAKRKAVVPWATHCIRCQEEEDKQFKGVRRL